MHGIHAVVGTTGFDDERLAQLRGLAADAPGVGVLIAPNFGIGAVLMMRFAAQAAPFFESVEIVELHHPNKADAPCGTARRTARWSPRPGPRPGSAPLPTRRRRRWTAPAARPSTACPCTPCGCAAWSPTRRCCSAGRGRPSRSGTTRSTASSFMPGVLLGVRSVAAHPGLTVGLDAFLGLDRS